MCGRNDRYDNEGDGEDHAGEFALHIVHPANIWSKFCSEIESINLQSLRETASGGVSIFQTVREFC